MATMHEPRHLAQLALDRMARDWHKTIDQEVMRVLLGTPFDERRRGMVLGSPPYANASPKLNAPPYVPEMSSTTEEVRTLNFPVWPTGSFSIGCSEYIEAAIVENEAEREKAAAIKAGQDRDARIDLVIADLQANLIGCKKLQLLVDAIAGATTDAKLLRAIGR